MTFNESYKNDIIFNLTNLCENKDRFKMKSIAMEALNTNKQVQNKYNIEALYFLQKEIKKSMPDFSTNKNNVNRSNGNIIKIENYDITVKTMKLLNELYSKNELDTFNLNMMNQLHDILINARSDFEYGYSNKIELLINSYNLLVMTLYEIININILNYTASLTNSQPTNFTLILNLADTYIKLYQNGEWLKLMKTIKNTNIVEASESAILNDVAVESVSTIITSGSVILFSFLWFLQPLVRYFYNKNVKIVSYIETQSEFLKTAIEAEKLLNEKGISPTSEKAIKIQEKVLKVLVNISEFIKVKILKTDIITNKEVNKSREELTNIMKKTNNNSFELI